MPEVMFGSRHGAASIRTRLVTGFAVLLGLLFAIAAVPLQELGDLTARTGTIVDRHAQFAAHSQRANQHAQAGRQRL